MESNTFVFPNGLSIKLEPYPGVERGRMIACEPYTVIGISDGPELNAIRDKHIEDLQKPQVCQSCGSEEGIIGLKSYFDNKCSRCRSPESRLEEIEIRKTVKELANK